MKRNHNYLKIGIIYFIILIFLIQTACSYKSVPVVVVREKVLRFGPAPVPLNEDDQRNLEKYIRVGGDIRRTELVDFYIENKTFYRGLLELFSRVDKKIKIKDFFSKEKEIYKVAYKGFQGPIVYDIIDATREKPTERGFGPLAVSDGRLWWILYRDRDNTITGLVVTLPYKLYIKKKTKN